MQNLPDRRSPVRAVLESTGTHFSVARYARDTPIFSQGDEAGSVLHIESGRAWLAVTTEAGKEAICGLAEADTFIGEAVLAGQTIRPHTATAMIATEVLVIAKDHMTQLLRTQPTLAARFIAHVLERSIRLETDLVDQLLCSSEERLARTLMMLAGCDARHPCSCPLPHISQEVIAEMVGTTRSRVNLFMCKFKKSGLIHTEAGVLHVDGRLLRRLHEGHLAM